MNIVAEARALMALLQPLTGDRAAGLVTVNAAPGPTAKMPPCTYGVPIVGGAARYDQLLKTVPNPDDREGWPVGLATPLPIVSNIGGPAMNLPGGTPVRWFPAPEGIESISVLDSGGLTGGLPPTGLAAVRQVAFFEELGVTNGAEILSRGLVGRFPAVVLAWESTGVSEFLGRNKWGQKQFWSFYVIASRVDAEASRRLEGLAILDALAGAVWGRTTVDGFHLSSPAGVMVESRQLVTALDQFSIYRVRVSNMTTATMDEYRTFNPWRRTRLDVTTPSPAPDGFPIITDNEVDMPQP